MNKMSLLTFALVVMLPGCGDDKNKATQSTPRNNVAKYMDYESPVTKVDDDEDEDDSFLTSEELAALELLEDEDEDEEDEEDEDEEEEEEASDEEEALEDSEEFDFEDLEDIEDNDNAFRWIDAQADDEFKTLYFSFNHYGVRPDQKAAVAYDIEQVKQLLAESDTSAQPTVVIEGHACQEGSPAYNVALSEKRAKNVADLFVAAGVDRSVIKVVGRGQECPAVINGRVVNGSREDRAPNRRVEVRVMYT